MANKKTEMVTFILTKKTRTSYQAWDGSFFDTPLTKRVIPEYTIYEEGKPVKCRHIRNEKSIRVSEQSPNAAWNKKRDNIYFRNGVCVLNPATDQITIEFLEKHPYNEDTPAENRRDGVIPYFRLSQPEAEGLNEIDQLHLEQKAVKLITSLVTKKGDEYVYERNTIDMMTTLFKVPGNLVDSQKISYLVKEAKKDPVTFLYVFNNATHEVKNNVDVAIEIGIIKFDKKAAYMNKAVLFTKDNQQNEEDMKSEIVTYLVSPYGEDKYKEMLRLIQVEQEKPKGAVGRPPKKVGAETAEA